MNITCPSCGANGSLELFMADREFRVAILKAAELPSNCGDLVLRYVGLFRPGKRQLTPARATKLITEISDLINAEEVKLGKQSEKILAHIWQLALQAVLDNDKLTLPLKNHNYLTKIALNMVNQYSAAPEDEKKPVVIRPSSSLKAATSIIDSSADQDGVAQKKLAQMSAREKAKLFEQAKDKLIAEGIKEEFIIKPMIDGMMLSIIKGTA